MSACKHITGYDLLHRYDQCIQINNAAKSDESKVRTAWEVLTVTVHWKFQ